MTKIQHLWYKGYTTDMDWPSFRRPITDQLYTEPCKCPHCLEKKVEDRR